MKFLTYQDHNRQLMNFTYVYPVVSRRARGISIGINLNPNNACNWRCIYCQVPNLTRGTAPLADLVLFKTELQEMLEQITDGDFMSEYVHPNDRVLQDIAFSGNGEPTSCPNFAEVLDIVEDVLCQFKLIDKIKIRLITNGSLMNKNMVTLEKLALLQGEVWFKLDAGDTKNLWRINSVHLSMTNIAQQLRFSSKICPTFIQTCLFAMNNQSPDKGMLTAYLDFLQGVKKDIKGVLLYSIARPSLQPESDTISSLSQQFLEDFAKEIEAIGLRVNVSV